MSTELAVPDYAAEIERAADPAQYVITACERAKTWLAHALEHGGIDQICELKSQAEAIRVYTMSKQLGQDAQLSATEIVRRAERGIGVAIRRGQDAGEIERPGQRGGRPSKNSVPHEYSISGQSPKEYFNGGREITDTYAMTDGITDEEFDVAVGEAKAEGNLSRSNVVRKLARVRARHDAQEAKAAALAEPEPAPADGDLWVPSRTAKGPTAAEQRVKLIRHHAPRGYNADQIGRQVGNLTGRRVREIAREHDIDLPGERVIARTRRVDSNRIVRETCYALDGLAMGVQLVKIADLDPAEINGWANSMTDSIRALNRLVKSLKEAS